MIYRIFYYQTKHQSLLSIANLVNIKFIIMNEINYFAKIKTITNHAYQFLIPILSMLPK